jgi:N-acetylglucosaminyldiphosphoundecaprenol N-acetyl-beta-D-mannosaminyltransferase
MNARLPAEKHKCADPLQQEVDLYQSFRKNALPRILVGGLIGTVLSREEWARLFIDIAKYRPRSLESPPFFSSLNGEVISRCYCDPTIRQLFNQSDGLAIDGMSAVFASRIFASRPIPERAATTDLFHNVARLAERYGTTMYLLGASAEQNRRAADAVRRRYPKLEILGQHHGYFTTAESEGIACDIDRLGPDIVWIAMGVPREQEFCIRHQRALKNVGLLKTSGGLFDFLSGLRTRAPQWMQNAGLEWLYRLCRDPTRLFARYAATNIVASWLLITKTRSLL